MHEKESKTSLFKSMTSCFFESKVRLVRNLTFCLLTLKTKKRSSGCLKHTNWIKMVPRTGHLCHLDFGCLCMSLGHVECPLDTQKFNKYTRHNALEKFSPSELQQSWALIQIQGCKLPWILQAPQNRYLQPSIRPGHSLALMIGSLNYNKYQEGRDAWRLYIHPQTMDNMSHLLGVISASLLAVRGVENCSSTVPSLQEWKHYLKVQGELHQPFRKEINIKHRRDHVWRTSTSGVRFSTVASTYHNRFFIHSPIIIGVKHYPKNERKLEKYSHFPLPWWEEQLFFHMFHPFFLSQRNFSSSANFSFWSSRKAEACDKVAC